MNKVLILIPVLLLAAACDDYTAAPVANSPVAPEVTCGDPEQTDNDSALECNVADPDLPVQDQVEVETDS